MNTARGTRTTCQDCGKVFSDANAWSSFISFWPLLRNIKGDWDGRNLNLTRNSLMLPWSVRMVRWWKPTKWSWLAPVTNKPSTSLAGKECVERTEECWLQNWVHALFLLATLYTSWTVWGTRWDDGRKLVKEVKKEEEKKEEERRRRINSRGRVETRNSKTRKL